VEDGLRAIRAVVDNQPVTIFQLLLGGSFLGNQHQMAEKLLISIVSVLQRGDPLLGNHQEVDGRLRVNVPESQALRVLEDDVCRDGLVDDLVEDGGPGCGPGGLGLLHLVTHAARQGELRPGMVAKATTTLLQTSSVIIFIKRIFLKTDLVSGVNFWTNFCIILHGGFNGTLDGR